MATPAQQVETPLRILRTPLVEDLNPPTRERNFIDLAENIFDEFGLDLPEAFAFFNSFPYQDYLLPRYHFGSIDDHGIHSYRTGFEFKAFNHFTDSLPMFRRQGGEHIITTPHDYKALTTRFKREHINFEG